MAVRAEDAERPNARDSIATSGCRRVIEETYDSSEAEIVLIGAVVKTSSAVLQGVAERVVHVGADPEWWGEW